MGWPWFLKLTGMTHQPSFAHAEFTAKRKVTRREKFLTRMATFLTTFRLPRTFFEAY